MNIGKNFRYKSLLICVMAVIFLCSATIFGAFAKFGINAKPVAVDADEEPVYAAYLVNGNGALAQLPQKQQSYVYLGSYGGSPVRWAVLKQGTLNNNSGTMLYSATVFSPANYQYYQLTQNYCYTYTSWATSYLRSYLNGTPYARGNTWLVNWSGATLTDEIFGTSGKLRDIVCNTNNNTLIYEDPYNTTFYANGSHLDTNYKNNLQSNYSTTQAYIEDIYEMTSDCLFPLCANDIVAANGFSFLNASGDEPTTPIVNSTSVNRNNQYFVHADGIRTGDIYIRNSVQKGTSSAARMLIDSNGSFDSSTVNSSSFQVAVNVRHSDTVFAICGTPESGWVNGTVTGTQGNRPSYKLFLKGSSDVGSTSGIFPSSAYVIDGKLNIDLSNADGNNYIDKYMVVIKDGSGNVVSSRGVSLGNYEGSSALQLDGSVLNGDILKDGYTLETFGYKSTSGNELAYCTEKSVVSVLDRRDITLTLDGVSESNELTSRIYGNSYDPVTATAVETVSGNVISGYGYVIQYNDETMSGDWTTTVPVNAGRYAVRAYGAATATYNEAVSDVAYLTINPRTLEVNFIDDYKISNTEGGTRQYNGQPYRIRAEFTNVVPGDNLVPITGGGNAINASDTPYKFNLYGFSAPNATIKNNYYVKNVSYPYLITRVPMTVEWGDLTHTYDGTQKDPTVAWAAAPLMPSGDPEVVAAERINAGGYTVTAEYNGSDSGNFEIVNPTETFTIERVKIWVSLSGRATYGQEAVLRYIISTEMSDPIPESDLDYIHANLGTVPLATNWTPYSEPDKPYYVIVEGHDQAIYDDYALMPNYHVEWHKGYYYPVKAVISLIEWSENDYTYNGTVQTVTATGRTTHNEIITLEITINKEFKNAANDYVATAVISAADAVNYEFDSGVTTTKEYEIKKAPATIVWSNLTHTYDGTQKNPTAAWAVAAVMPAGDPEAVAAERINAGSYAVQAEYNGADKDNFTIVNDTETFVINPRELVISWNDANGGTKVYDGTEYVVGATFTNVVSGDTVIPVITGDNGINASETPYVKTVTGFTVEEETVAGNYVLPSTGLEYGYTITKRNVTVSWSNTSLTYNATAQKPTATWTDGVALNAGSELVVNGEQVNAGSYTATVTISGLDANNFTITNASQSFTIGKATATIVWSNLTHTYDGTQKNPTVTWANGSVVPTDSPTVLSGTWVNAGSYTVSAAYYGADKNNFNITNTSASMTINKVKLWISLNGNAVYGEEAVLSANINSALSDPVPASERDMVNAKLESITLASDYTPTTVPGTQCYVIVEGHDQSTYTNDGLLQNYRFEFHKGYFYSEKANIILIEWSENDYTYNGTVQTVTATGRTTHNEIITLEITINKEFKNAANDYVATAVISAADAVNYEFDSGVTTTKEYEIKKAPATIVWSNLTHTYDGTQKNPTAAWAVAAVMPAGDPEAVAAERINAGSYAVQAEYNGADKDNFNIVNASDVLVVNRADLTVTITLTESSVIYGDDFDAEITATWYLTSEQSNNALLASLISGYTAGDDVGVYTITLDFEKAEEESRRSPETFIDNYRITVINEATLTVNKRAITASEFAEWVNNGDVVFDGETVLYDGNVHMIYADINGSACGIITVGEYLVDGSPFNGASAVADYNVIAVIAPVNGNYTAEGFTLSAILQIYENNSTAHEPENTTPSSGGDNVGGGVPINSGNGFNSDLFMTLFLIIVIIATVFGFIAILVIVKKFRDEIAE